MRMKVIALADSIGCLTRYKGKKISVIGDSISTLEGHNPENYKVFYTKEKCALAGIGSAGDTWWGLLAKRLGCEVLVNNSFSGSRVTKLPDRDGLFPSGCSDERTSSLHKNETQPDIVIVYLGTNDWYNGVSLEHKHGIQRLLDQSFSHAYNNMLDKIRTNYPSAEIWCCTLCPSDVKNESGQFPFEKMGVHMKTYGDIIKDIAAKNNYRVIDLYSYGCFYSTVDGYHPDCEGMKSLADMAVSELTDK